MKRKLKFQIGWFADEPFRLVRFSVLDNYVPASWEIIGIQIVRFFIGLYYY